MSFGSARVFGVVSWVQPLINAIEMRRRPEPYGGDEISLHAVRWVVKVLVGLDGT